MEILNLFINFINKVMSFKVLGVELITYLLIFTVIIFIFKVISIIGNAERKVRKEKSDK